MLGRILIVFCLIAAIRSDQDVSLLDDLMGTWGIEGVKFEELPEPADLVHDLTEDELDYYLDFWLEAKYEKELGSDQNPRAHCSVPVNSLPELLPVYIDKDDGLMTVKSPGNFEFNLGETFTAYCGGNNNKLNHSTGGIGPTFGTFTCDSDKKFSSNWLNPNVDLDSIGCIDHSSRSEKDIGNCLKENKKLIEVGLESNGKIYETFKSCFDDKDYNVLYVEYKQNKTNRIHQTKVSSPDFGQGGWFGPLNVNNLYTQSSQKSAFEHYVGPGKAATYVTPNEYLTRGHLAAKTDFVLSQPQRATYTFINVAPQWNQFNGVNWALLEQDLRERIAIAGYETTIYTGTWGILELDDDYGTKQKIYLDKGNDRIPVPLWYWKLAYEPKTNKGTVFIGLNNPHILLPDAQAQASKFCPDVCINNPKFTWLKWKINQVKYGYVFCCTVSAFKTVVNYWPTLTDGGLLD